MRANVPPSPLLSALSRTSTYLSVTMSNIVHTMMDRMPGTASGPPLEAFTASRRAYSGLVPISPKTTPIEPSARAQTCRSRVVCPSSVPWAAAACAMEAAFLDFSGSDAAQHELGAAYTPAPAAVKAHLGARLVSGLCAYLPFFGRGGR